MMEQYRQAEDEYFKLRGQFDTGRITQEQFDEKLRALMRQDAQGRYWMLGADSGKWYQYDGSQWVLGDPYTDAAAGAAGAAAAAALASAPSDAAPPVNRTPPSYPPQVSAAAMPIPVAPPPERNFPLVPVLVGAAIVVLGILAFLLFQNRDRLFVSQPPQITPILAATITRAPSPTPLSAARVTTQPTNVLPPTAIPVTEIPPTGIPPTDIPPTNIPATSAPAITVIVVTAVPTPTTIVIVPTGTPTLPLPTLLPTVPPTRVPTRVPRTNTPVPPTNTPVPGFPPGVYVTKLETSPSPRRNQNVTFTATFFNNTGETRYFKWLVLLYDPEKAGSNKGFGESPPTNITVPPGETKFSVTYEAVTGPGPCKNLYMRAGWRVSTFDKPIFPNTVGDPTTVYFDVCP